MGGQAARPDCLSGRTAVCGEPGPVGPGSVVMEPWPGGPDSVVIEPRPGGAWLRRHAAPARSDLAPSSCSPGPEGGTPSSGSLGPAGPAGPAPWFGNLSPVGPAPWFGSPGRWAGLRGSRARTRWTRDPLLESPGPAGPAPVVRERGPGRTGLRHPGASARRTGLPVPRAAARRTGLSCPESHSPADPTPCPRAAARRAGHGGQSRPGGSSLRSRSGRVGAGMVRARPPGSGTRSGKRSLPPPAKGAPRPATAPSAAPTGTA